MAAHKTPPAVLKALGKEPFPRTLDVDGQQYIQVKVYKHDFFAATGLFADEDGRQVVLKIGRMARILGLPAGWIGVWLARREARIYQALDDLDGVPCFVGMWGKHGFIHEFAPGRPLQRDDAVRDTFFDELDALIGQIHDRGLAYVDLEKCENIIVGEDQRPYLIDFQISWHIAQSWGSLLPLGWLRDRLQEMDRYHLLKHRKRTRPDQLTTMEIAQAERRPWYIRAHRRMVAPLQKVRRGFLRKVDPDHASAPR
jgi:hypothetical protein